LVNVKEFKKLGCLPPQHISVYVNAVVRASA